MARRAPVPVDDETLVVNYRRLKDQADKEPIVPKFKSGVLTRKQELLAAARGLHGEMRKRKIA